MDTLIQSISSSTMKKLRLGCEDTVTTELKAIFIESRSRDFEISTLSGMAIATSLNMSAIVDGMKRGRNAEKQNNVQLFETRVNACITQSVSDSLTSSKQN